MYNFTLIINFVLTQIQFSYTKLVTHNKQALHIKQGQIHGGGGGNSPQMIK